MRLWKAIEMVTRFEKGSQRQYLIAAKASGRKLGPRATTTVIFLARTKTSAVETRLRPVSLSNLLRADPCIRQPVDGDDDHEAKTMRRAGVSARRLPKSSLSLRGTEIKRGHTWQLARSCRKLPL